MCPVTLFCDSVLSVSVSRLQLVISCPALIPSDQRRPALSSSLLPVHDPCIRPSLSRLPSILLPAASVTRLPHHVLPLCSSAPDLPGCLMQSREKKNKVGLQPSRSDSERERVSVRTADRDWQRDADALVVRTPDEVSEGGARACDRRQTPVLRTSHPSSGEGVARTRMANLISQGNSDIAASDADSAAGPPQYPLPMWSFYVTVLVQIGCVIGLACLFAWIMRRDEPEEASDRHQAAEEGRDEAGVHGCKIDHAASMARRIKTARQQLHRRQSAKQQDKEGTAGVGTGSHARKSSAKRSSSSPAATATSPAAQAVQHRQLSVSRVGHAAAPSVTQQEPGLSDASSNPQPQPHTHHVSHRTMSRPVTLESDSASA